jgi:hypothetical protein
LLESKEWEMGKGAIKPILKDSFSFLKVGMRMSICSPIQKVVGKGCVKRIFNILLGG